MKNAEILKIDREIVKRMTKENMIGKQRILPV